MSNPAKNYPRWFLELLASVTDARPKKVIDLILEHGQITTEELQAAGYEHAPRAARDVREKGIPLITGKTKSSSGKSIAFYKFPDDLPEEASFSLSAGRKQFPKKFRDDLAERDGEKCAICNAPFPARSLQIDHRIPYEVSGDSGEILDYMLLCGSCNRSKSWTCEHCSNWVAKDIDICKNCYWAYPYNYEHVATLQMRRTEIVWMGEEILLYQKIANAANLSNISIAEFLKQFYKENEAKFEG